MFAERSSYTRLSSFWGKSFFVFKKSLKNALICHYHHRVSIYDKPPRQYEELRMIRWMPSSVVVCSFISSCIDVILLITQVVTVAEMVN
uniref:Uncharacterized protein n=1 Tax=Glossina brevipalpis TaxID=37001 RepID=A0A1A9WRQ8_9MUSC